MGGNGNVVMSLHESTGVSQTMRKDSQALVPHYRQQKSCLRGAPWSWTPREGNRFLSSLYKLFCVRSTNGLNDWERGQAPAYSPSLYTAHTGVSSLSYSSVNAYLLTNFRALSASRELFRRHSPASGSCRNLFILGTLCRGNQFCFVLPTFSYFLFPSLTEHKTKGRAAT